MHDFMSSSLSRSIAILDQFNSAIGELANCTQYSMRMRLRTINPT